MSEPTLHPDALASLPIGLLRELITPAVIKRAIKELKLTEEKMALLLVKAINPHHHFTQTQEGLLRNQSQKTIGKRKAAGELPAEF